MRCHALTLGLALLAVAALITAGVALGQDYPSKPIRLIVPFPPGGPTDIVGRIAGRGIEEKAGKAVIIENRPGAGGLVGLDAAARTAPDGYTFVLAVNNITQLPFMMKDYTANLSERLTAVSLVSSSPYVVLVRSDVPAQSIREFVDYVRANPDKLNYGIGAPGGPQFVNLLLNRKFGLKMAEISYQGTAQMATAIIRGDYQMVVGLPGSWIPLVKQGQLRAIAVLSDRRYPMLPGVATLAEQGVPEFEGLTGNWFGIMAPAGTPKPIIDTAGRWIAEYVRSPAGSEQIIKQGFDPEGSTPQEFAARFENDEKRWAAIARAVDYHPL
jgi:tripartite-type tricarboxylate transporter receptor subunit TctC